MEKALYESGNLLCAVLASCQRGEKHKNFPDGTDFELFYKLAKRHKVSDILYPYIKDSNLPEQINSKFKEDYNSTLSHQIKFEAMEEKLFLAFSQNGIAHIPLKGAEISRYYKEPLLRFSSDIDIYIAENSREKVKELMLKMGFSYVPYEHYDDVYHKNPLYNIEVHHSLTDEDSPYHKFFCGFFDRAKVKNGCTMSFEQNDLYIYTFFHLFKHYTQGGCGIRLFLDLYVLERNLSLDYDYIEAELIKIRLLDFYKTVKHLMRIMFGTARANKNDELLLNYIYYSGIYGIQQFNVLSIMTKEKVFKLSKLKFYFKAWFLPLKQMRVIYPVLQKVPLLLPFCYLHKGIYTFIFKRDKIREQKESIKFYNSQKACALDKIMFVSGIHNK